MATEEANATTTRTSSRPSFDERIINNCSRQGEEDADEQREDEAVTMISRSNKYRKICHSSRDDADDEENPNTLRQKRSRSSNAARANPSMGTTGTATGTTMMSSSTSSSASSSFSSRETPSTNSSTKRNSSDKNVGLPYRYCSVLTELAPLDHYPKLAQMNKQRQRFQETVDTEQLSDDVLGKCLFSGYLDTLEVLKLSTVSKRIQSIAKDKVKMLDLHNLPMLTPTNVATLVSNFPNVTDLNFSYCPQFAGPHLEELLPVSGNLKSLKLRGTAIAGGVFREFLSTSCLLLAQQNPIKPLKKRGRRSPQPPRPKLPLECIDLSATTKEGRLRIGDETAFALKKYCPMLKSVSLGWSIRLTDIGVSFLKSLKCLSKLDLSMTSITSESCHHLLEIMTNNGGMTELDLSATRIDREGILHLFVAPQNNLGTSNLTKLSLRFLADLERSHVEKILSESPKLLVMDVMYSGREHGGRAIPINPAVVPNRKVITIKGMCVAKECITSLQKNTSSAAGSSSNL